MPGIALTATATRATHAEITARLKLEDARHFVASFDRPNIQYRIVPKNESRRQLLELLRTEHQGDVGIVYCRSRASVETTAEFLVRSGIEALPYHAGLDSRTRAANQARFLREDGLIVVATIAFGMGIDKPDVRFVAHLDLPRSVEGYYQETGRADRDGLPATASMAYGLQAVVLLRKMIDTWDGTIAAQKLLSTVYRLASERHQKFGAGQIVDILLGKQTPKVIGDSEWRAVVRQLLAQGVLAVEGDDGTLALTGASAEVLARRREVLLRRDPERVVQARPARSGGAAPADLPEAAAVFEQLRAWRAAAAREQGVPAYMIFHDATLRQIAADAPPTLAALTSVHGVGESKLAKYGQQILAILSGLAEPATEASHPRYGSSAMAAPAPGREGQTMAG